MLNTKSILGLCIACSLMGCAGRHYSYRTVDSVDQAAMDADSARIRKAEREERAERRRERRQEMMDEADAIRRAHGNRRNIYIIR